MTGIATPSPRERRLNRELVDRLDRLEYESQLEHVTQQVNFTPPPRPASARPVTPSPAFHDRHQNHKRPTSASATGRTRLPGTIPSSLKVTRAIHYYGDLYFQMPEEIPHWMEQPKAGPELGVSGQRVAANYGGDSRPADIDQAIKVAANWRHNVAGIPRTRQVEEVSEVSSIRSSPEPKSPSHSPSPSLTERVSEDRGRGVSNASEGSARVLHTDEMWTLLCQHEGILKAMRKWWDVCKKDIKGRVSEKEFTKMNVNCYKALIFDFDLESASAAAKTDWTQDAGGKSHLVFSDFRQSLMYLVDTWTLTSDPREYVHFLNFFLDEISRKSGSWRVWRRIDDVEFSLPHWLKASPYKGPEHTDLPQAQTVHRFAKQKINSQPLSFYRHSGRRPHGSWSTGPHRDYEKRPSVTTPTSRDRSGKPDAVPTTSQTVEEEDSEDVDEVIETPRTRTPRVAEMAEVPPVESTKTYKDNYVLEQILLNRLHRTTRVEEAVPQGCTCVLDMVEAGFIPSHLIYKIRDIEHKPSCEAVEDESELEEGGQALEMRATVTTSVSNLWLGNEDSLSKHGSPASPPKSSRATSPTKIQLGEPQQRITVDEANDDGHPRAPETATTTPPDSLHQREMASPLQSAQKESRRPLSGRSPRPPSSSPSTHRSPRTFSPSSPEPMLMRLARPVSARPTFGAIAARSTTVPIPRPSSAGLVKRDRKSRVAQKPLPAVRIPDSVSTALRRGSGGAKEVRQTFGGSREVRHSGALGLIKVNTTAYTKKLASAMEAIGT